MIRPGIGGLVRPDLLSRGNTSLCMGKLRKFVIVQPDGEEVGLYTHSVPGQAAVKAVNATFNVGDKGVIRIRELGSDKIRVYNFEVMSVPTSKTAPSKMGTHLKCARVWYMGYVQPGKAVSSTGRKL